MPPRVLSSPYDVPDSPPPRALRAAKRSANMSSLERDWVPKTRVRKSSKRTRSQVPSDHASASLETARRQVRIAIDAGTTSTTVSFTVSGLVEQPACVEWNRDRIDLANYETPAIFHYQKRGDGKVTFLCGYELEDEISNKKVRREDVVSGLKVAILQHEDFAGRIRERIENQLAAVNKKILDLWIDYLEYLVNKTKAFIRRTHDVKFDGSEPVDITLLIAQPNLSEPDDNLVLREAARRIECTRCFVVPEADCGAIRIIAEDPQLLNQSGNKVIVLDLGGGFCSPTAHRVETNASSPTGFDLEPLASSNSRLAGSILINEDFKDQLEQWMRENGDDLNTEAAAFGISPEDFRLEAVAHFERHAKKNFSRANTHEVAVLGAKRYYWNMNLSKEKIEWLFQRRMVKIYDAFDELLVTLGNDHSDIKFVMLRGGLATSEWVQEKFQEHYPDFTVLYRGSQTLCPVSHGALLSKRDLKAIEQTFHIGTVRDEFFDAEAPEHQDCVLSRSIDKGIVRNEKLVAPGRILPSELWAICRLKWLVTKAEDDTWTTSISWEHLLVPKQGRNTVYKHEQTLYYTRKMKYDGEPLLEADGDTWKDHIKKFIEFEVNLGERKGWKERSLANGSSAYELFLGTKIKFPKAGPMSGPWQIRHAIQAVFPDCDEPVGGRWAKRCDKLEIFDPKFSHVPLEG